MTRDLIIRELKNQSYTAKELSQRLNKSVAAIENDLEHVRTSMRTDPDWKLKISPAHCQLCEYRFQNDKIKTPTKCPKCKKEKINPPSFLIEGK
ncbi:MAG: hypothetical protein INQ03_05320 [Candidatus Heimdallarchaeota archaeon]|nr:hypothetical protein [Candidatus Heimdallarchaeota archaeon]